MGFWISEYLYGNLDIRKIPHSNPTPVLLRLRHLLLLEQVGLKALLYIKVWVRITPKICTTVDDQI